ncbi:E3 ubiquitin-ligase RNF213-like, partial [Brachionus plicatilis]
EFVNLVENHLLNDFPRLSYDFILENITFGSYQLKQSLGYLAEHLDKNGKLIIKINKQTSLNFKPDTKVLMGRIQSRHSGAITYKVFVSYIVNERLENQIPINGWYCTFPLKRSISFEAENSTKKLTYESSKELDFNIEINDFIQFIPSNGDLKYRNYICEIVSLIEKNQWNMAKSILIIDALNLEAVDGEYYETRAEQTDHEEQLSRITQLERKVLDLQSIIDRSRVEHEKQLSRITQLER